MSENDGIKQSGVCVQLLRIENYPSSQDLLGSNLPGNEVEEPKNIDYAKLSHSEQNILKKIITAQSSVYVTDIAGPEK